ncbi:hypothetical protein [Chitinophaga flava]|uniref:Uncharacterized protein n=1 Tax=Chitinophaga flava TaxID=2259036 RepID=A0A365XQ92_9BACT|nr:hypothetical protein [Chitinophaga flava]RBL88523.1 hypothetical protein DF182_18260 [Chitinophaga flava]
MKQFLIYSILFTILTTHFTFAQSNISANRVAIKDSLSLKGAWINSINNDSTLKSASDKSISTDGALKKYILQALNDTANNRFSLQSLFDIFSMKPRAMKVDIHCRYVPGKTAQSYDFEFISSDSIVTTLTTRPGKVGWEYVFGKPPFTIKCKSVAVDSGWFTYLNMYKRWDNPTYPEYVLSRMYAPGDSIIIEKPGVVENNIRIEISYDKIADQPPGPFSFLNTKLINLTNDVAVGFWSDIVLPGMSERIGQRIYSGQGIYRYSLNPGKVFKTINDTYSFELPLTTSVEFEIWTNGQLSGITRYDPEQPYPEFSVTLPVSDLTIYVRDVRIK